MGYGVWPSGRLHLPEPDDATAVAAVKAAWASVPGVVRFDGSGVHRAEAVPTGDTIADSSWVDAFPPSDTIADIAWAAAASVSRDGDWLEFAHDDVGDPKWKKRTTTFYVAIAPFVRSGTVRFVGEGDERWSYTYADGQITQQGLNGWDHSIVIGGTVTTLAYTVASAGRLHLPKSEDAAAVAAVKAACVGRSGWFHPDMSSPSETLVDMAWVGAALASRDGDWIEFGHRPARRAGWFRRPSRRHAEGPHALTRLRGPNPKWPKWSDQVTAFYAAIAPFVRSGTIQFIGEDESPDRVGRWPNARWPNARWSYTYAAGQITQQGWNGWDKSIEPFGEPVEPPQDPA